MGRSKPSLILAISVFAAAAGACQTEKPSGLALGRIDTSHDPPPVVSPNDRHFAVFGADNPALESYRLEKHWSPTEADGVKAWDALNGYWARNDPNLERGQGRYHRLQDYIVQMRGVYEPDSHAQAGGKTLGRVRVLALEGYTISDGSAAGAPMELGPGAGWRKRWIGLPDDGGDGWFHATYNPQTHQIVDFSFQGR